MYAKYVPEKPLFFLHIPKSGGSALRSVIYNQLGLTNAIIADDDALRNYDQIKIAPLNNNLINKDPINIQAVIGHLSLSSGIAISPNVQILTIVRMPALRLISHYIYWRYFSNLEIGDELIKNMAMTSQNKLSKFLSDSSIAMQIDNIFVRLLLWPDNLRQDQFISEDEDQYYIDKSLDALDKFSFIEIYEKIDLVNQLADWFGRDIIMSKVNSTPYLPIKSQFYLHESLTREAFSLLEQRTRLDEVIWRTIALRSMTEGEINLLRQHTYARTFARYGAVCAPSKSF